MSRLAAVVFYLSIVLTVFLTFFRTRSEDTTRRLMRTSAAAWSTRWGGRSSSRQRQYRCWVWDAEWAKDTCLCLCPRLRVVQTSASCPSWEVSMAELWVCSTCRARWQTAEEGPVWTVWGSVSHADRQTDRAVHMLLPGVNRSEQSLGPDTHLLLLTLWCVPTCCLRGSGVCSTSLHPLCQTLTPV